jgi:DNA-binding NarL/FixJ family response regulator
MMNNIRLLLIDDHGLFRESLSRLLQAEPDIQVEACCESIAEATEFLSRRPVDIVLLDYDLGESSATAFFEAVRGTAFNARVLMVTAGMGDAETLRIMELGASGIFLKHSPPSQLIDVIHRVVGGEVWLDPKALRAMLAGSHDRSAHARPSAPITPRERSVLKGVFEGLTNKEIAEAISLSESSVKAALQQLFDKTGVRTRSQLVRIALERYAKGWVGD